VDEAGDIVQRASTILPVYFVCISWKDAGARADGSSELCDLMTLWYTASEWRDLWRYITAVVTV